MKWNMGTLDRVIRMVLAVAVGVLIFTRVLPGAAAIVLGILAGANLVAGAIGWCPVYPIFGWSTRRPSAR